MKRKILIILVTIIMLVFTGCNVDNLEISENITTPKNNNLPISGEWVVEDYRLSTISGMDEEDAKSYLGMEALFHEELVCLGDEYCLEPSFKIKNVNAEDYLKYHFKTNPELLDIQLEEIQIISITGPEHFINEFIKVSEDVIITNIDGIFFYLKKVDEEVDKEKIKALKAPKEITLKSTQVSDENDLNSGILLGLKSLDLDTSKGGLEKWDYRTIFIRSHNKDTVSVSEMEGILLPRMTGFWKIEVNRENVDDKVNDDIVAYPIDKTVDSEAERKDQKKEQNNDKEQDKIRELKDEKTIKNILFVSNNYISIENIYHRNKGQRYLEFYPVDNIDNNTPIKLSDIMGESGKEALIEGFNKDIISRNEEYKNSLVDINPKEESFGLFRRNGYWMFKGRVNYIKEDKYIYEDFNINAFPPEELVSFDELAIPWNVIKTDVPEALDVFISPNKDIAVILTHNEILVYQINNGKLEDEPIEKIGLNSAEKVVMAEWAVGRYPQIWERQFTQ